MHDPNCRGSNCDFTGSRIKSDATPGRCTETSGYIAYAEVTELLSMGDNVETFHDGESNTDVMLHKGELDVPRETFRSWTTNLCAKILNDSQATTSAI